jgi:AbiJ N-terminal domain 4
MANRASFSKRQGYVRPKEIVFRDELPDELRQPIIDILWHSSSTAFLRERIDRLFNPYGIDELPKNMSGIFVSTEEHKDPDFIDIKRVLLGCEWFRLYDLIEDIFQQLDFHDNELRTDPEEELQAYPFQSKINDYFVHAGIGWQLVDGKVMARGDAAFEYSLQVAETELKAGGRTTAAECIEDAIRNLSFRPEPRLGAAVSRAMNAMECVLHDITGENKMGFGDYLQSHPDLFPVVLQKPSAACGAMPPMRARDTERKAWSRPAKKRNSSSASPQRSQRTLLESIPGIESRSGPSPSIRSRRASRR